MRKVLVSCVGDTDPYRNCRDGAICHIIRNESNVEKVYLYFSKEILKSQILNQRYTRAIKSINPKIEIEIYPKLDGNDELNKYLSPDYNYSSIDENELKKIDELLSNEKRLIVDAHLFDGFYKDFYQILSDIRNNEKDSNSEIIFNISSGTPAMKSALRLLDIMETKEVTFKKKFLNTTVVQTSTPSKSSSRNIGHSTPQNLEQYKTEDVEKIMNEEIWENYTPEEIITKFGVDEEEAKKLTEVRCKRDGSDKTTQIIIFNDIKEMFESYDYFGVSKLINEYKNILPEKIVFLGSHLGNRISGKTKDAEKDAREIDLIETLYPIYDEENLEARKIIEKFNILKIKNKRDEINDWLLISTPLEEKIYMQLLDVICGIKKHEYMKTDLSENMYFDLPRLNGRHREFYNKLRNKLKEMRMDESKFNNKFINGKLLNILVQCSEIGNDPVVINKIKVLENTRTERNKAAHTIDYITREDIERRIDRKIEDLEECFRYLIKYSYYKKIKDQDVFKRAFNVYDIIESLIVEEFEKEISN